MYKKSPQVNIGKYIRQIEGYEAFIPEKFPPKNLFFQGERLIQLLSTSSLLLGKLDASIYFNMFRNFFLKLSDFLSLNLELIHFIYYFFKVIII